MDQTLGVWLREVREAKGSTLEELAAATRIRPRFLVMMEDGDFAAFPGGEVQIRGFLRIVARYLGLPAEDVLARYDAEVHGSEPTEIPTETVVAPPPIDSDSTRAPGRFLSLSLPASVRRRGTAGTMLIWGVVLIVIIGVGASVAYVVTQRGGGASRASIAVGTPVLTQPPTVPEAPPEPTATPTLAPNAQGGVTVALEATEHVWVRVTTDDRIAFVGFLSPEETKSWSAVERVLVDTGNGAGLQVAVNDRPLGTLGARGEVSSRAWGPYGEIESS